MKRFLLPVLFAICAAAARGQGQPVRVDSNGVLLDPTTFLTANHIVTLSSGLIPTSELGSGTASSSTFLRGDGVWATPSGAGNVSGPGSSTSGALALWNGTSGTVLQNSTWLLTSGNLIGAGLLDVGASGTQVHFGTSTGLTSGGGYLSGISAGQAVFSSGGYYTGSAWMAENTSAAQVNINGGTIYFYGQTGLTAGNTFTPTQLALLSPGGFTLAGALTVNGTGASSIAGALNTTGNITLLGSGTSGSLQVNSPSGSPAVQINRTSTSLTAQLQFQTGAVNDWQNYTSATSSPNLNWYANGSNCMTLTQAGNLGVTGSFVSGGTSPSTFAGPVSATNTAQINGTGNTSFVLNSTGTDVNQFLNIEGGAGGTGSPLWQVGATGSQTGLNAGANFYFEGYSDSGSLLGDWLGINRATGTVTLLSGIASSNTTTGAFVVVGGGAFGGALNIGGALAAAGNITAGTAAGGITGLLTLGNGGAGNSGVQLRGGSTQSAWQVGSNITVANALEFAPSTSVGGTTFSTPAMYLTASGLTVGAGYGHFTTNSTYAGLNVGSYAGNPATPNNGDLWYNSSTGALMAQIAGSSVALGAGGGGGTPAGSSTWVQYNNAGSFGANSGFTSDTSGNVTMTSLTGATGQSFTINAPSGYSVNLNGASGHGVYFEDGGSAIANFTSSGLTFSVGNTITASASSVLYLNAPGSSVSFQIGGSTKAYVSNSGLVIGNGGFYGTNNGALGVALNTSSSSVSYTDSGTANGGTATIATLVSLNGWTLAASHTTVTTSDAATFYVAGGPSAGTNQTITRPHGFWDAGTVSATNSYSGEVIVGPGTSSGAATTVAIGGGNIVAGAGVTVSATLKLGAAGVSQAAWGTAGVIEADASSSYTDTSTAASGTAASEFFHTLGGGTLAATNTGVTTTDVGTLYLTPITAGTNQTFTRSHSLVIVDADPASDAVHGAVVVSSVLGTASTSVSIGNGNIVAGGNVTVNGTLQLGNAYNAGTYTSATGSVDLKDSNGTTYHVLVHS